jgi:DsbC/DsbD-like thiol-disulfide interchange protein
MKSTLLWSAPMVCLLAACGTQPVRSAATPPRHDEPAAASHDDDADASEAAESAVRARLDSSVMALNPGKRFLLATRFDIPDGYWVSWLNPGDVGNKPVIAFKAPDGFELGALMFPGPRKFTLRNGAVGYGYDKDTAVFVEVRAPEALSSRQSYRFELDATWFSCNKGCSKDNVQAYFELEATGEPVEDSLDASMRAALEAVPKPLESLEAARTEWRKSGVLAVHAKNVTWKDFYPSRPERPSLRKLSVDDSTHDLVLEFDGGSPGAVVEGVALADVEGRIAYVTISAPWPSQAN